jgi:predicted nucleotidyltransferase
MSDLVLSEAHHRAVAAARRVVDVLAGQGVAILIGGSLAKGGFHAGSDIDFLVAECPRELKYAIEARVEDILGTIPFDVIYLDEVPRDQLARFMAGAVDVRDLG